MRGWVGGSRYYVIFLIFTLTKQTSEAELYSSFGATWFVNCLAASDNSTCAGIVESVLHIAQHAKSWVTTSLV